MDNTTIGEDIGKPCLPIFPVHLSIPYNEEVISVEIIDKKSLVIEGEYKLLPCQPSIPISEHLNYNFKEFEPDKKIYSLNTLYPKNIIDNVKTGNMSGYKIATFSIYPIQYIPAKINLC